MARKKSEKVEPAEYKQPAGKTTIAPEVLLTIARLTTLTTPGVSRMSNLPSGVNRLFKRGYGNGVRIDLSEDVVNANLYVVLCDNINMREVSHQIQNNVARAITEMVGMQVGQVNIHIEDIDYPIESGQSECEEV